MKGINIHQRQIMVKADMKAATQPLQSAGKMLGAVAGVKPEQCPETGGMVGKFVQMFKSISERLPKNKEEAISYIKGTPVNTELADGTKQVKVKGKLVEETFSDGLVKKYKNGVLSEEHFPDGGYKKYDETGTKIANGDFTIDDRRVIYKNSRLSQELFSDGRYKKYRESGKPGLLEEGNTVTGDYKKYHHCSGRLEESGNKLTGDYKKYSYVRSYTGGYNITDWTLAEEGNIYTGNYKIYYEYDYEVFEGGVYKGTFKKPSEMYDVFRELVKNNKSNMKVCILNDLPNPVKSAEELKQSALPIIEENERILTEIASKYRNKQSLSSFEINRLSKIIDIPEEKITNMDNATYIELCKRYHPKNSTRPIVYSDEIYSILQEI